MLPEFKESQQQIQQQSTTSSAATAMAAGSQQGQADVEHEMQAEPNPFRSLGDALKEIRRRFDDILRAEKREVQEQIGDTSIPSQVEYLHPDDSDHDMQTLGPANEEQVVKLDDLKLVNDDAIGTNANLNPMDVDVTIREQHEAPEPAIPLVESEAKTLNGSVEGAVTRDLGSIQGQLDVILDPSMSKADAEMEDELGKIVESQVVEWQKRGFPEEGGEHVWRLYESLTHDLAYALCEQLRLILEPTLATRLKGDYRTGKRLNMKKIIPYIASDYTKDKRKDRKSVV